jgi:hypothetical protein
MGLEGLPWPITVKAPPFIEPNKPMAINLSRQEWLGPGEQVIGQSDVVYQHTLVVPNILDDNIGNRARLVDQALAAPDQRSGLFP